MTKICAANDTNYGAFSSASLYLHTRSFAIHEHNYSLEEFNLMLYCYICTLGTL